MVKNIVCLKWGDKYSSDYVNILYNMVKRNMSEKFRFVCITEDSTGLNSNIDILPLLYDGNNVKGWWHKLSLFKPQIHDIEGEILFLDLDIVIVNQMDHFFSYEPGNFAIIKDWIMKNLTYNSSVMRFEIGKYNHVWDEFIDNPQQVIDRFRGDQDWITEKVPGAVFWPHKWCLSYKWHKCWEGYPLETKMVVFHGHPNPPEAISKGFRNYPPAPWIKNFWR